MNPMMSSLFDVLQQSIEGTLNEYISAIVSYMHAVHKPIYLDE